MEFMEEKIYDYTLIFLYVMIVVTCLQNWFLITPMGKHKQPGWGPSISSPLGWFLMESPTVWLTLLIFPRGRHASNPKALLLMAPYLLHYLHRTLIYPARLHLNRSERGDPGVYLSMVVAAFGFNLANSYQQTRWVSHYKEDYDDFWWKFNCGVVFFAAGMVMNVWADGVLMRLKKQSGGYANPRGGVYELVSCPNFLGEIIEWMAWWVMTSSYSGFAFFLQTCAALIPRAVATHKWYLHKFEDYPRNRKALIPFLY